MATHRPRVSILALFDPLSSSSDSPDSDKENDCGDSSFFHPHGFSQQVFSPVHRLRRRLIDVGEMTVEEPDIRDLIEEELEAEISKSVALEEDENATLTFRDMVKAATPKWSAKHAARKGTPNTWSSPRTPLAEITARDETTPRGRKKTFKRPAATSALEASPLNVIHTAERVPTLVIHDLDNTSGNPTLVPLTVISGADNETTKESISPNPMETSTATLELPTSTGPLISDTPIPLSVSTSSLAPNHAFRAPISEGRLRPNAHVSQSIDRHSADLHASFQLHLSSSETTFDLLNDKISFLGSKSGLESFLDHEDVSFGDDDVLGVMNDEVSSDKVSNEQRTAQSELETNIRKLEVSKKTLDEHDDELALHDVIDEHASFLGRSGIPTSPVQTVKTVPDLSTSEAEIGVLSTPSPSHHVLDPPRPVPALRIVKRIKAPEQAKAVERNRSDFGTLRAKTSSISASRAPKRASLEVLTGDGIKNGGQVKTMNKCSGRDEQSAGGPRRVFVTEVSKRQDAAFATAQSITVKAKSLIGVNGPRRVPASDAVNKIGSARRKGDVVVSDTGKQPVKLASVGLASASGIPKPVSGRNIGSKIPAPSKRFREQDETVKGNLGRRFAGK